MQFASSATTALSTKKPSRVARIRSELVEFQFAVGDQILNDSSAQWAAGQALVAIKLMPS